MTGQTPRERLRQTLERNAALLAELPKWAREAVSTESVFKVALPLQRSADRATPNVMPDKPKPDSPSQLVNDSETRKLIVRAIEALADLPGGARRSHFTAFVAGCRGVDYETAREQCDHAGWPT